MIEPGPSDVDASSALALVKALAWDAGAIGAARIGIEIGTGASAGSVTSGAAAPADDPSSDAFLLEDLADKTLVCGADGSSPRARWISDGEGASRLADVAKAALP